MQVKKQQLEPDMEQWTGSKSGKEYVKAVFVKYKYLFNIYINISIYLTYMQTHHVKCWAG